MMISIAGLSALTPFSQKNLLNQIQEALPDISSLNTQFVYLFDGNVSDENQKKAITLLNDGKVVKLVQAAENQLQLITTPRVGTISPWSTKAGDIFANCDVPVERVERATVITLTFNGSVPSKLEKQVEQLLHDRMTQSVFYSLNDASCLFSHHTPKPLNTFDLLGQGKSALEKANIDFGFALSDEEVDYLTDVYVNQLKRNPTDTELMMFAQANSEHCRHKIFNSEWIIDGEVQPHSLFGMIKNTYKSYQANYSPNNVLSAYKDNASVITGHDIDRFYPQALDGKSVYGFNPQGTDILMKVETHNHPTGIAPFAGAATGSGGEIRDEGATGRGSKPKAGLTAFNVSHLHLPDMPEPWEKDTKIYGKPSRMASSLEIMIEAPLGGAAYNNEFGRPALCGYFRSFQLDLPEISKTNAMRGYHKPIMLAGGYGNINRDHVQKNQIDAGDLLIVLGGPAMLIGLGGGAASSVDSGAQSEDLDFASVQRQNPEIERRCQEVIDTCWAKGNANPIVSIHDVGAGGISNAMPELVNDAERGAVLDLRKVPSLESGMSPMEIWSNEAQERYVLAIKPSSLDAFNAICERERCPYAVLGEATDVRHLTLNDPNFTDSEADLPEQASSPVDMPMQVLLGGTPSMSRSFERSERTGKAFDTANIDLKEALLSVLRQPTVASKSFLISIGDRSITGMVARDQYVGRYQVPVADCAVTTAGLDTTKGEAMAMGERPPVALLNPAASARLAVSEAITNIAASRIEKLDDIKMSANWMAAAGHEGEDEALYDAVHAIGMELCPKLGIAIPVGKDSLSMRAKWNDDDKDDKSVTSPMTVVITAFAPVQDVTKTLTPELKTPEQIGASKLVHIDLGHGKNRLAGSILAQVYNEIGGESKADTPDLDNARDLINFFNLIQEANAAGMLAAYHDIGDGGLLTTLAEMQFTNRLGVDVCVNDDNLLAQLFAEELGAVVQVGEANIEAFNALVAKYDLAGLTNLIGSVNTNFDGLTIRTNLNTYKFDRVELQTAWASVSHQIQRLRDNPACADEEFALISDYDHQGLIGHATFDLDEAVEEKLLSVPFVNKSTPKIAVLREQGVNGQLEMAASFVKVGFEAVDVHMSDLLAGRINLEEFNGLVACGGFSYGDVLGAGGGWAKSILFHDNLRQQFAKFFERDSTFTLGVCNGCQMVSQLKDLIPGGKNLPRFRHNTSARFEARTVNVRIDRSKSVLLDGMDGSILPIAVAHGEGRVDASEEQLKELAMRAQISMRYVDSQGNITQHYPLNPNGSPNGITGLCSEDGRVTIMMPHPERNTRALTHSWKPEEWQKDGAWMRLFRNARVFVG